MTVLFCEIHDVADFLQIAVDEPACTRAITEATACIQNYCQQLLYRVTGDTFTFDVQPNRDKLFLPELPVVAVTAVVEDGTALVVTDDYQLGQHGILHRVDTLWTEGIQTVAVTYTHGYLVLPDDVKAICARAASRAYQAGLLSAFSLGVPGIASKSLGDYSVSFHPGASSGLLGASAAPALLDSEKRLLDRYRYQGY